MKKLKLLSFPSGYLSQAISRSFGDGFGVCPIIRPGVDLSHSDFTSVSNYVNATAPYDIWRKGRFSTQIPNDTLVSKTLKVVAACEARNQSTNRYFDSLGPWPVKRLGKQRADILMYIREDLETLVSDFSPIRTFSFCKHGNGASENSMSPLWKKMKQFSATPWVAKTLGPIYETLEGYIPDVEITTSERFSTVEKTFKILRPIGIQPSLNLYFQLGVGGWLKTVLKKQWKVDLTDQDKNRVLACLGSISDSMSTIDLSSASDTISRGVIKYYFENTEFYEYLTNIRTTHTAYSPTDLFENQKFSSMGNGFTFELETALFGAIVRACYRYLGHSTTMTNFAVYGDDMIVLDECTPLVVEMLQFHGFTVNVEKSFSSGPFRESCGSDYYLGQSVRNTFIKEDFDEATSVVTLVKTANALYRKFLSYDDSTSKDCSYRTWKRFLRFIPKSVRTTLAGPIVEHDQWLIGLKPNLPSWNLRGEPVLLALNAKTKPVKCDEYLRMDAWFYLANRRKDLVNCNVFNRLQNRRCCSVNTGIRLGNPVRDCVSYHPSVPESATITYIGYPKVEPDEFELDFAKASQLTP